MTSTIKISALVGFAAAGLCVAATAVAAGADAALLSDAKRIFAPLPAAPSAKTDQAELGRRLFFETRVSADGNVSCSHCHLPDKQGSDGLPKSFGVFGKINPRNAPTIFNAALQFKAHWRGDRETIEEQAEKSPTGAVSFGNPDFATVIAKLKSIPGYTEAFAKAFPGEADPVTQKNWGKALGVYERTLPQPTRFDAFLNGDAKALTPAEQAGLRKFIDIGCVGCHDGVGIGGDKFAKFGVVEDYWKETGSKDPDKGRADVTKNDADFYVFKVPSLRNVAKTGPYFHDGSVAELPQAVRVMAKVQLGADLSDKDVAAITAFLGALTQPVPAHYSALTPFPDDAAKK
ncbi:c-type cytochrome [Methylosinus sporium]|uniref:C-type cytochrome n=1 Tax=Methylosinus sporium TaxID=428 RepID=A0A549SCW3_METSR|nr:MULTISPECIES: cytochrome c peroxidase [Methylosinus]MBU3889508.1 c-type cytochrome [Methylosinus sp. KRF6]TRL23206.1 c-type cytochrome [Methylosinus sporium]